MSRSAPRFSWARGGEGREVADGEAGELDSRTPGVFDGGWKNPDKGAEAFRGAWCSVGDTAHRHRQDPAPGLARTHGGRLKPD